MRLAEILRPIDLYYAGMEPWKNNISFVLVEPREPGNIGAAARAMKNMGFVQMELVKPGQFMSEEAIRMACNAVDMLGKATVHPGFDEAIKGKSMIVGTTRRVGKRRGVILPLREGSKRVIAAAKRNRVAILFGREDRGLNNREVEQCGFLVTIPSDSSSPSLNLAQSVLLVAYELSRRTYKAEAPGLVTHERLGRLYEHLKSTLTLLEYIPRGDRDLEVRIMRNLRHLLGRAGLTDWEWKMVRGICSQIEKKITRTVE